MFRIVLVEPEIPPNTGNVIRLAANTGCELHLVAPLGFRLEDRLLRRAGLDYHEHAAVTCHRDFDAWRGELARLGGRAFAFTTRGAAPLRSMTWQPGDWLVFGGETAGMSGTQLATFDIDRRVRLPMRPGQRSLNLSNAVAVAVFDAWRQQDYGGAAGA